VSHSPLTQEDLKQTVLFRGITYTAVLVPEPMPQGLDLEQVEAFHRFLYNEILEHEEFMETSRSSDPEDHHLHGCRPFHILPRFVSPTGELLSFSEALKPLLFQKKVIEILEKYKECTRTSLEFEHKTLQRFTDLIVSIKRGSHYRVDEVDFQVNPTSLIVNDPKLGVSFLFHFLFFFFFVLNLTLN
jgi:hypothetical protein